MLYNCKPLFEKIKAQVGTEIDGVPIEDPPRVCIITTGDDEPSQRYVRNKLRDFKELGIVGKVMNFFSLNDILHFLDNQEKKMSYDGIIVQRPILVKDASPQNAAAWVSDVINPRQDIDGVAPGSGIMPPVRGLDLLLHEWDYDPAGKTAVVIGRGDVGRPVAEYLLGRDATVAICHSKTSISDQWDLMKKADILVGAAGLKEPIFPNTRGYGGVVIDYGITRYDDTGELHGDFETVASQLAEYQTPVPGGMGLMVRAGLLMNIVDAYKRHRGLM